MNRLRHKIGIAIIFLLMAYAFWTNDIDNSLLYMISIFSIIVLFAFFGYWRLYRFYRLEKIQKLHTQNDFVNYFENMDYDMSIKHFVCPMPISNKLATDQENKIRTTINISTVMVYLLFVLLLVLLSQFKN